MVALYVFPVPVALVVWALGLKGLFSDYMYMIMPFLPLLPPVGLGMGYLLGCPPRGAGEE
jgi:hypothetical protein